MAGKKDRIDCKYRFLDCLQINLVPGMDTFHGSQHRLVLIGQLSSHLSQCRVLLRSHRIGFLSAQLVNRIQSFLDSVSPRVEGLFDFLKDFEDLQQSSVQGT